jgi:N-acetylneuraminate synthase
MHKPVSKFMIDESPVGEGHPTYFIADIAANHDGDLNRAIDLIYKCKESGASAAKFQHFKAEKIVSKVGFKSLGEQKSHQSKWKKSVFEVYKEASVDLEWTLFLKEACQKAGISFFTSPYDMEIVDFIDKYVPAYKIGSGDITWHDMISHIASKNKPYILATGASSMDEVHEAVQVGLAKNSQIALLQCNTNYTGDVENFRYVQLNVLRSYQAMYPNMILGLSDHTPGNSTVLGAIALGAKIIEKHFTDDISREGPDHRFSMDPKSWREMVDRANELENALGNGIKRVEQNECETVVLQRRSLRAKRRLSSGHILKAEDLIPLRPCPENSFKPYEMYKILGKALRKDIEEGDCILWIDV